MLIMKYHIVTYGCQMNLHESEKIAGMLKDLGYATESPIEDAEIGRASCREIV